MGRAFCMVAFEPKSSGILFVGETRADVPKNIQLDDIKNMLRAGKLRTEGARC